MSAQSRQAPRQPAPPQPAPPQSTRQAGEDPAALIREARRRQRRRQTGVCLLAAALLAGGAAALRPGGGAQQVRHPAAPLPRASIAPRRPLLPAGIPASVRTTVLMWPAGGGAVFSGNSGPDSYVADLGVGRPRSIARPGVGAGDWQPLLVRSGRWLFYVSFRGVMALPDTLTGHARLLSDQGWFGPAATPGQVWLVHMSRSARRSQAWLSSAAGRRLGGPVALPRGSELVQGTDAGLLLFGRTGDLALWQPGQQPRKLPGAPSDIDGVGFSARLLAYGTGCQYAATSASAFYQPNAGYRVCTAMRVLNLLTGGVRTFRKPAGTAGWVPDQFAVGGNFSPGGSMLAAYAASWPLRNGRTSLYVVRLAGHGRALRHVPSSAAPLYSKLAWSVRGSWLLYQGPGIVLQAGHLSAYRPRTGQVRSSAIACCQYTVMVSMPG
jgi:hypothetical protein